MSISRTIPNTHKCVQSLKQKKGEKRGDHKKNTPSTTKRTHGHNQSNTQNKTEIYWGMDSNPFIASLREAFTTIPPVTRSLLILIIAVFIGQQLIIPSSWVCFGGFWQTYRYKYSSASSSSSAEGGGGGDSSTIVVPPFSWKEAFASFFLSSFAHLGFLHILMNSLVLVLEGGRLEKVIEKTGRTNRSNNSPSSISSVGNNGLYGSTQGTTTISNGIIITTSGGGGGSNGARSGEGGSYYALPSSSSIFLALTVLLVLLTNTSMAILHMLPFTQVNLSNSCVLGLSGVLFGYFAYGCYTAPQGSQVAFCGVVNMPAFLFPWVMLLFTFLIMPSASFSGHFFGVVWGIAFAVIPIFGRGMRALGAVLGRGAVVCPSFMTLGGTSRGTSPVAGIPRGGYLFSPNQSPPPVTGGDGGGGQVPSQQQHQGGRVLGGGASSAPTAPPTVLGRAVHPDVSSFAPVSEPPRVSGDTAIISIPSSAHQPHQGGEAGTNPVMNGIPLRMMAPPTGQQQQQAVGGQFKPFSGEGRKLGGGGSS